VSAPATARRPRPGRPSTGARERILEAALAVMKRDGYAGLTTAKVAAASGQNKALIAYHFGSKQGLVAAVGAELRDRITADVLEAIGEPADLGALVRGLVDGVWRVMERDEGLQRVYFDLASQSVVDEPVRSIMRATKEDFRATLKRLLASAGGPRGAAAEAAAVYLIAGVEGLAMERLERGETPALRRARELFVATAPRAIARAAG